MRNEAIDLVHVPPERLCSCCKNIAAIILSSGRATLCFVLPVPLLSVSVLMLSQKSALLNYATSINLDIGPAGSTYFRYRYRKRARI